MRISLGKAGWSESRAQGELARVPQVLGLHGDWECKHELGQGTARLDTLFISSCGKKRVAVELQLGNVDTDHLTRLLEYAERERHQSPEVRAVLVAEACDGAGGRLANCLIREGLVEVFCMHVERTATGDKLLVEAHVAGPPPPAFCEKDFAAHWSAKPGFSSVRYLLDRVIEEDPRWIPTFQSHIGGRRVQPNFNCVAFHGGRSGIYKVEIKLPRTPENDSAVTEVYGQWTYKHEGRPRLEHYCIKMDSAWPEPRLKRLGDLLVQANRRWLSEEIAR